MHIDQLFLRTLEDLEARLKSRDWYEILHISVLLRRLVLDQNPLMDQVNRERRQRIKFTVNDRPFPPPGPIPDFHSVEDGFDPDTSVPHLRKPIEVSKGGLLSRPLIIYEGHTYTVKELIQHTAYVRGVLHTGEPKNQKQIALQECRQIWEIGGLEAGLRLLQTIGRVVRKGLEPLRRQISGNDEEQGE